MDPFAGSVFRDYMRLFVTYKELKWSQRLRYDLVIYLTNMLEATHKAPKNLDELKELLKYHRKVKVAGAYSLW